MSSKITNLKNKTKFITTRFGNVLASNGSVVPIFKAQIESGGPITVTHPDIERYFMTIIEATQLVLEAGAMGKGGEVFVFDMGKPVKIVDLAKNMVTQKGLTLGKDIHIKYTGLRPGEKLYEELLIGEKPEKTIRDALLCLVQTSPPDTDNVQILLNWAIENWQPDMIPARSTVWTPA